MIILVVWVLVVVAALWLYFRQTYSSFEKNGVKCVKTIPNLFRIIKIILGRKHLVDSISDLYEEFPEERFIVNYEFTMEKIMIRDVELVKKMAVKDFDYFVDHHVRFSSSDSYFSRNIFSLRGQEWRDMRCTLSPAFTSSKIRNMVPFMVEVGDQMIRALKNKVQVGNEDYIDIECKDLTTRYACDVIASCAFGLKTDSHTDENNKFYTMGKSTATFSFYQIIVMILIEVAPKIVKFFKLDFLTDESKHFFRNLVLDTMRNREHQNIFRPDMIHLLIEARKGNLKHEIITANDEVAGFATVEESSVGTKHINKVWSDDDLVAQAVLFFVAGFETVSSAMSFLLYELALNTDVQERLAEEIKEHDKKNNGKFEFNSIQKMVYMDMVVSEILRLWSPGAIMDRVCVKDYNLGKPNDKADRDFIVRRGTPVGVPTFAIHRDRNFFPNPDKFDPERFSEENKRKIKPNTYIPFGIGPRNCIGSRFALCEIKVITYQILQHFVLSPCDKTCIPAQLCPRSLNIKLKGGHWLRFSLRR